MIELRQTPEFERWFARLRDSEARLRILARLERLAGGNPGDCNPVGEGVLEMRIHYGPGYRVYYVNRGERLILLLAGGDKKTQEQDIRLAWKLARKGRHDG